MKKEIWKDILGYERLYQVSNFGRVKSLNYHRMSFEKILKQFYKNGYYFVTLVKNKIHISYLVHRLVAQAFIDNPDNLPQVNHKDENKLNNSVDNLEWCDASYNINYGNRNKRVAIKKSKKVYQYDLNGNLIKEWSSITECEKEGFNRSNIINCCQGKRKKHKGFKWSYLLYSECNTDTN